MPENGQNTYKKHVLWIQNVHFLTLVAGVGFEPHDLQVMSLTSYQTALSRDISITIYFLDFQSQANKTILVYFLRINFFERYFATLFS